MHENFCVSGTGEGLPSPLSLTFWGCVGEEEVEGGGLPLGSRRALATEFAKWPTKRFVMDALAARIET